MSDYLDIVYNKKTRPYTNYPNKLILYLYKAFQIQKGMKLLDPGCGRGEHLRIFQELGLNVYGMDISPEAPSLAPDLDVRICDLNAEPMPYEDNYFDVIYNK